jgi:hypothetical protein
MKTGDNVIAYRAPVIIRGEIESVFIDQPAAMISIRRTDGWRGSVNIERRFVYPNTVVGRRDLARVIEDDAAEMQREADRLLEENVRAGKQAEYAVPA